MSKKNKNHNTELAGVIVALTTTEGTIKSIDNFFTFKLDSCKFTAMINDDVIFLVGKNNRADAVRKVFMNIHGIKFSSRVDQSHIHIELEKYLPDLIADISNYDKNFIEKLFEYPNVIGTSECVRTSALDEIIYEKRKGRNGLTRFVLKREPEDCSSIFGVFLKTENYYSIITIFIGKKAGKEPWDANATEEDKFFWTNHALIYDDEKL